MRQELAEARKRADEQSAKLASLCKVVEEVSMIEKDVSKLLSYFTKAREHRVDQEALERQPEIEIDVLKDREKTLDRDLASVKKELRNVNVQNASFW